MITLSEYQSKIRSALGSRSGPGLVSGKAKIGSVAAPSVAAATIEPAPITKIPIHNQQSSDRCVAASICAAMHIAAGNSNPSVFGMSPPSVVHAYHKQRVQECRSTNRCACGPSCGSLCDETAGALVDVMLVVCSEGVTDETAWPTSKARDPTFVEKSNTGKLPIKYKLKRFEKVGRNAANIMDYLRTGIPVVLNLFIFPNQTDFWFKTKGRSSGSGPTSVADSVDSVEFSLPAPLGTPLETGHCVLGVGVSEDGSKLIVQNSMGAKWGKDGFFNIPITRLTSKQLYEAVAILESARIY